jgi:cold shock protein
MARGTVKWFNSQKGYGFIQPQGGGIDVFVHISAVERAGLTGLNEGQVIEYEEVSNRGKTSAENLIKFGADRARRNPWFRSLEHPRISPSSAPKIQQTSRPATAPFSRLQEERADPSSLPFPSAIRFCSGLVATRR